MFKSINSPAPSSVEIHDELKRLHLAVEVLTVTVRKLHEEQVKHNNEPRPTRKTFGIAGNKQHFWS